MFIQDFVHWFEGVRIYSKHHDEIVGEQIELVSNHLQLVQIAQRIDTEQPLSYLNFAKSMLNSNLSNEDKIKELSNLNFWAKQILPIESQRDFVYCIQGYLEISDCEYVLSSVVNEWLANDLEFDEVKSILKRSKHQDLSAVDTAELKGLISGMFIHVIDPQFGDNLEKLQQTHNQFHNRQGDSNVVYTC
ncbi:MAG: hypothetical protein ACRCXZ_04840 [Patescibacteria group bacterium]